MIQKNLRLFTLTSLCISSLYAQEVAVYKAYFDITFDSAKNSILAGSTTATAKGYSSMLSNPAGMSTNHNITIYARTTESNTYDKDDNKIKTDLASDHVAGGVLYDSFGIEYKLDDYIVGAAAYGYESKYGLFSVGVSYLLDETDLTQKDTSAVARDEFASGDYMSYGFMWQKSFVDEDNFYGLYFGYSKKDSGQYSGDGNPLVIPISPLRTSYGIGLETNLLGTTLLVTADMSEESWSSVGETLSGVGYGVKWMIGESLALGVGVKNQTFSGAILSDIQTLGAGVEFSLIGIHFNVGYTKRDINDEDGLYLTQESAHADVALTF